MTQPHDPTAITHETSYDRGGHTTIEENKRIVRRLPDEAVNEGNLDVIDEIIADYVSPGPVFPEPLHGPEELKKPFATFQTAFPDVEFTVVDLIAEGDKVVRRDRITGTDDGEFMGIEPTGKEDELAGVGIFRIEDGQFVVAWGQVHLLSALQQLGVVEPPTG